LQYKDTHPKDDAKQVINSWFLDQKSRIEQLNQQEKLYFEFTNRSAAPGAAYEVWSQASVAESYRSSSEHRTLDDLWKLRDRLRGEPQFDEGRVAIFVEVEGAADYLPAYAGNLDIMTAAAVAVGEQLAKLRERTEATV